MLPDHAFYFFGKEPGAGGLPTGTGGGVACLLSGGIDSPVAAYRMMRRGCSVLLIHFHSYPILSRASQEKVREIAALLTRYQLRSRLMLVPFGELQQQVVLGVPPELRVVIYRRLMLRIAERLARRWHARALVTGEVIGQVASQTLENLTTIAEATTLEVLRPLVGMDKDEITAEAERIGTLPISNIPDQDCCQLFTPRHPATRAPRSRCRAPKRRCRSRKWSTPRSRRGRGGLPVPGAKISGWSVTADVATMSEGGHDVRERKRPASAGPGGPMFAVSETDVRRRQAGGDGAERSRQRHERRGGQPASSSTGWRGPRRSAPTPSCAAPRAGSSDRWRRRPASGRPRFTICTWRWAAARPAASPCRRSTCARWPTTRRAP